MVTLTKGFAVSALADLFAAAAGPAGALHGAYVALFTAIARNTPDAVLADLTEANFTGYARQALATLGSAYASEDDRVAQDCAAVHFQPSDAVAPNLIVGYALVSANVAGTLLAFEVLAQPVSLADALSGLTVTPRIELPPEADWGEAGIAS